MQLRIGGSGILPVPCLNYRTLVSSPSFPTVGWAVLTSINAWRVTPWLVQFVSRPSERTLAQMWCWSTSSIRLMRISSSCADHVWE